MQQNPASSLYDCDAQEGIAFTRACTFSKGLQGPPPEGTPAGFKELKRTRKGLIKPKSGYKSAGRGTFGGGTIIIPYLVIQGAQREAGSKR